MTPYVLYNAIMRLSDRFMVKMFSDYRRAGLGDRPRKAAQAESRLMRHARTPLDGAATVTRT